MKNTFIKLSFTALTAFISVSAFAQALPYGAPISLEAAKKVAQAAAVEMHKKNFQMTIAIVDSGGNLVYLERNNQAGLGTVEPAIGKAKAANGLKTPTKVIEDEIVNNHKVSLLAIPGAYPIEGGVPLVLNKQVIGAIGVSGAMPSDDGAIANVGAKSLTQ